MHLRIDPEIFTQHPDLKIGAIILRGINNTKRVSSVESLLRGICAQRKKEFADKEVYDDPMVHAWSQAYGRFGINPKKHAPSITALLKRVKAGKEIPHINLLVDLYNYFSLKYLIPIGGEDLDWLYGDLNLTFTKGGEPFRPLGSIDIEFAKEGEVAYKDNAGITCRYWNHRECERTKFRAKSNNVLLLIEDMSRMHMDSFGALLKDIQNNLIKYIGGQIEPYILNEENREIDLQVEGRTHADDSKVPQQERAHFLSLSKKNVQPSDQKKKSKINSSKLNLEDPSSAKVQIQTLVAAVIKKLYPEQQTPFKIDYPVQAEHGDYSCNAALILSKKLGKPPREIAEEISSKIEKGSLIEKIEIAGPGFINFFLSDSLISSEIKKVLSEKEEYGKTKVGDSQNIIFEYSSPNIAKPLGVHHLLSTIIGQSLYNIHNHLGFKAISINHIGDWGTQFGKLIYAYKKWGDKSVVEKDPITELLKLYVQFHNEAETDSSIEDEARKEFKNFEEGDKNNRELWEWFVEESMKEVNSTYDRIGGIHFDYTQGESFYEDKMAPIIADGKEKKIFVDGEQGALVMEFEDENMPTVPIQKKDGATLYITRDLATLKYRLETFDPVKVIYVVDIAQTLHFKQIFEGARRLGWYGEQGFHAWFGRMHLKDGKASTRKGNVILLNDVLDEAVARAAKVIAEKNPDLKNKDEVARAVGIGAVKYNVLSQNRTTDITFDWDIMLSFDGNSAPYLQYSYARARSILRKSDTIQDQTNPDTGDTDEKIRALTRLFPRFSEQIGMAAAECKPNILSNYIFELAQKFNSFYNSVPVLRADSEEKKVHRLQIVQSASQIIKNGLALLGVEVVEEM
jgi:arginyl-tRNA synthetase